jgi:hypothetical protein
MPINTIHRRIGASDEILNGRRNYTSRLSIVLIMMRLSLTILALALWSIYSLSSVAMVQVSVVQLQATNKVEADDEQNAPTFRKPRNFPAVFLRLAVEY